MTRSSLKYIILPAMVFCTLPFCAVSVPAERGIDRDTAAMRELERGIRDESIALLAVIKRMNPSKRILYMDTPSEMVKLVSSDCLVYEAMDRLSRAIAAPGINDELEVIEKIDEYYHVMLPGGRDGWIEETCVQPFSKIKKRERFAFTGVPANELRRYIRVTADLFRLIENKKMLAEELAGRIEREAPAGAQRSDILERYHAIETLHGYARHFYMLHIEGYHVPEAKGADVWGNLSAWGELLVGGASYGTAYSSGPDAVEEGFSGTAKMGGSLDVTERSSVDLSLAYRSEVIQTAFTSISAETGFEHDPDSGLDFDVRFRYFDYTDDLYGFNDYNRLTGSVGVTLLDTPKRSLLLDYAMMVNSYELDEEDDYYQHGFNAVAKFHRAAGSVLTCRVRSRFEFSDAALHQFERITPSIVYTIGSAHGSLVLSGSHDHLHYEKAGQKNYERTELSLQRTDRGGNVRTARSASLGYKNFVSNDRSTYLQVRGGWLRSTTDAGSTRVETSLYNNFYTHEGSNSFSDLKLGMGGDVSRLYGELSAYFRLWHKPGDETDSLEAKPHVLDLHGRAGIAAGPVRFGPTFGLHALVSKGVGFKRDGNLIRVGGSVEGRFRLPRSVNLTVDASYEYGFVYGTELSVDDESNVIFGDITERNPVTAQLSALATMPVSEELDLVAKLSVYRVRTDATAQTSIHPVTARDRFTLYAGLRYRYN